MAAARAVDRFDVLMLDSDVRHCERVERALDGMGWNVQRFADVRALTDFAGRRGPACVVLELDLPHVGGLAAQAEIRQRLPHAAVVFVAERGDVWACVQAMRGGAIDFLQKPLDLRALREAVAYAETVSRERWRLRLDEARAHERLARLTRRERAVLDLVIAGLRNKQIAHELESREATVKVHRSRLMRKLGARSLPDLLRFGRLLEVSSPGGA
jgi:FixJ family two-component response regulator